MKKFNILLTIVALGFIGFGFMYGNKKTACGPKEGLEVGNVAPDLKFTGVDGKEIAMSSLRGKIVLLDFWASWCGPCRMENPSVVEVYNKFKAANFKAAKGFTVYSVSLDTNKDRWIAAIQQDKLDWTYHVSDLGGWRSKPAELYGINSIPMNYLLDAKGVIIAKNLRGAEALEAELQNLVK